MALCKAMHCPDTELGHQRKASIFIGTFDMGEVGWREHVGRCCALMVPAAQAVPGSVSSWLNCAGEGIRPGDVPMGMDMYAIGTQESAVKDSDWIDMIRAQISTPSCRYEKLVLVSLWAIRLLVLVKEEHVHDICHVHHATLATVRPAP